MATTNVRPATHGIQCRRTVSGNDGDQGFAIDKGLALTSCAVGGRISEEHSDRLRLRRERPRSCTLMAVNRPPGRFVGDSRKRPSNFARSGPVSRRADDGMKPYGSAGVVAARASVALLW
jgi:hypothetical protein